MEAELTAAHGKVAGGGSKYPVVGRLGETLNNLSSRVCQGEEQRSPISNTELVDLLTNLNMTTRKRADDATIYAATVWATAEEQEDVGRMSERCRRGYVIEYGEHHDGAVERPVLGGSRRL